MSREEDQAQQAGEKYADDQINSDPFMDWVWEQLVEASRMDPSEVLPLKTKVDALVIAGNMLQQLEWDAKRDLDGRDIARLIGVDITEREDVKAFFDGFERATSYSRDWLAEEILHMRREIGGGGVSEARRGVVEQSGASDSPLDVPAIAWRERIGPLPRGRKPDPASYVEAVPGEGGADWGYTGSASRAKPLSPYWQRRFRADMERVNARARFIPAPAAGAAESRRGSGPVKDPFYIIQGIYAGGQGVISDSFGFDDKATARAEAKKLLRSPHFEGDYVRIITRDGELVWDSQEEASRGARRGRRSSGTQPETGFQVKLLEGGWVHVPSFEAASAAISAERDRLGVGASAWERDTGHVVDTQGRLVAHISYNGRIWPEGSKYGPRESTPRRARRR